jgi:hypothetical protein
MYSKTLKMPKKMKSPEKTLPAETAVHISAPVPTQDLSEQAITGMEREANAPKQTPPAVSAAQTDGGIQAAVWQNDKRVSGLYNTYHARNAWMHITGLGWKRVSNTNDSSQEAMNMLASHCREKACRIDFSEEGGIVKEIYVW